jgi:serine phosphatase RsbU (regulator of sigma subunit)
MTVERPRRRVQAWIFTIAFLGLLAGCSYAAWEARRWAIDDAAPGMDPDYSLAWFIAIGGGLSVVGLLVIFIVTERGQRRLYRANLALAEQEARGRAAQEVAGRLARALSSGDVVQALLDHLPTAVGGKGAAVAVLADAGLLELLDRDGQGTPLEPAPGSVIATVLERGEPAWLQSPLGWRGDAVADQLAEDGWAMAVLPLVAEELRGLLAVSYGRVHTFVDEERAQLETVGVLASRAFSRGQRYDAEHRAALAFQRSALPAALPEIQGMTIAARYEPGAHHAAVGGDWYDVIELGDDRVALLVGDVVGHGMAAAAAMGRVRTAFQTIAPLRQDPGAMVRTISGQVELIPDAMCSTVVCVIADLRSESIRWCRAGHLPPLRLRNGEADLLDGLGLPPLGVGLHLEPTVHHEPLERGDVVVLYTDGVVERRKEPIDDGLDRLRLVGEALADLGPEDFCKALVEAMVPAEEQTDDVAVLVMRFDGAPR